VSVNETAWNYRDTTWAEVIVGVIQIRRTTNVSSSGPGITGTPCTPIPQAALM
jgi:hypothetical protein